MGAIIRRTLKIREQFQRQFQRFLVGVCITSSVLLFINSASAKRNEQELSFGLTNNAFCRSTMSYSLSAHIHQPLFCQEQQTTYHRLYSFYSAPESGDFTRNMQEDASCSFIASSDTEKPLYVKPFVLSHKTMEQGITHDMSIPGGVNGHRIEILPKRIELAKELSSEYMLGQLRREVLSKANREDRKRYEIAIMEDQISRMKGQHYINANEAAVHYQSLMDAGVEFAKENQLKPGSPLTIEQMKALKTDIVWLVSETITIDGVQFEVLVPQIYIAYQLNVLPESEQLAMARNLHRGLGTPKRSEKITDFKADSVVKKFDKKTMKSFDKKEDLLGAETNYESMQRGITLTVTDGISAIQDILEHTSTDNLKIFPHLDESGNKCDVFHVIEDISNKIHDEDKRQSRSSLLEFIEHQIINIHQAKKKPFVPFMF